MKPMLLVLLSLALFSGLFPSRAGWSTSRRLPTTQEHQVASQESLSGNDGIRWRRCQASHWRACILQR